MFNMFYKCLLNANNHKEHSMTLWQPTQHCQYYQCGHSLVIAFLVDYCLIAMKWLKFIAPLKLVNTKQFIKRRNANNKTICHAQSEALMKTYRRTDNIMLLSSSLWCVCGDVCLCTCANNAAIFTLLYFIPMMLTMAQSSRRHQELLLTKMLTSLSLRQRPRERDREIKKCWIIWHSLVLFCHKKVTLDTSVHAHKHTHMHLYKCLFLCMHLCVCTIPIWTDTSGHPNDLNVSLQVRSGYQINDQLRSLLPGLKTFSLHNRETWQKWKCIIENCTRDLGTLNMSDVFVTLENSVFLFLN